MNESINEANSKALHELPSSVQDDLMPQLDSDSMSPNMETVKRFRIQANGVEARTFFASLVKVLNTVLLFTQAWLETLR